MMQPISAPIIVPGTQQEPTTVPSTGPLGTTTPGANIIHITPNGSNKELQRTSISAITTDTTSGPGASSGNVSPTSPNNMPYHQHQMSAGSLNGNSLSGHSKGGSGSNSASGGAGPSGGGSGLRRFASIGGSKKLTEENQTLKLKIQELERYLTGLKEELILATRQIHAKTLEAKQSQEKKLVEIHELGQHIQKCEFDLLAKTAECETMARKLQHQTKDQMLKLRQIDLLETEIMDFRRMSIVSGGAFSNASSGAGGGTGTALGATLGVGSAGETTRVSGGTWDGAATAASGDDESVRSSAYIDSRTSACMDPALVQDSIQIKLLREELTRRDETIQELSEKVDWLGTEVLNLEREKSRLEQQQREAAPPMPTADATNALPEGTITAKEIIAATTPSTSSSVSASTSLSVVTASSSLDEQPLQPLNCSTLNGGSNSGVNTVGYDLAAEHARLLSRYQALSGSHALTAEYMEALESENRDLKIQLLDIPLGGGMSSLGFPDGFVAPLPAMDSGLTSIDGSFPTTPTDQLPNIPSSSSSSTSLTKPGVVGAELPAPILTRKSSRRFSKDSNMPTTPLSAQPTQTTSMIDVEETEVATA